jgi:hypothetical protein
MSTFAIGARQNRDVAAGALEHADVVPQLVDYDRRNGGTILDQADDAAGFREAFSLRQPGLVRGTQRQKPRRDINCRCGKAMTSSSVVQASG